MANTYSWKIQSLIYDVGPDSEGHSDVVIQIESKLIASDGEDPPVEASSWVTTKVTWEEGDQWIPYGDLVESDVVGWVEDDLGADKVADMKSRLDGQIEDLVNPTEESTSDMPWDEDNGA